MAGGNATTSAEHAEVGWRAGAWHSMPVRAPSKRNAPRIAHVRFGRGRADEAGQDRAGRTGPGAENTFYVEIYFTKQGDEIVHYNSFESTDELDPYLEDIDLSCVV